MKQLRTENQQIRIRKYQRLDRKPGQSPRNGEILELQKKTTALLSLLATEGLNDDTLDLLRDLLTWASGLGQAGLTILTIMTDFNLGVEKYNTDVVKHDHSNQ